MSPMLSDEQRAEILAIAKARSEMREQRPEEYRAAMLLQNLLDGDWFTPRDIGELQGMHDFDLRLNGDGRTLAVEVTTDKSQTDTAFHSQIERHNPLSAPGLAHSWFVLISPPGENHTDQAAAGRRSKSLANDLPIILTQVEAHDLFDQVKRISRWRSSGESKVVEKLRCLGVQSATPMEDDAGDKRILLNQAALSGVVGSGALVEVVQEHLPRKSAKLVRAREKHGADEVHLFIWLSIGEKHRFGRAEALHHVGRFGLGDLEAVDLQGVNAVWIALDAGPEYAPDCRHLYPIVCYDADGWHDWRMRRS